MLKGYYADFKRYLPLLFTLTSRDIKLKYRRSVLGIVWSILNPLLIMIVMTQVFTYLLRVPPPDVPFAVFYIVGATLFNFFSEATNTSMSSVIGNSALIKKVYIPKYIFPLEKCLFSLVNMLFSMIAVIIVMSFYVITGEVVLTWKIFLFFIPMGFCFLFTVGMSMILSSLTVYFRDILHLWGVILTVWMYLTPIIYGVNIIEGTPLMWVVRCNPLYYFTTAMRDVLIYGVFPSAANTIISAICCLVTLIVGGLVFKKAQDRFILHI